jgi:hypothetical protein
MSLNLARSVHPFKLALYIALLVLPGGSLGLLLLWWLSRRRETRQIRSESVRVWKMWEHELFRTGPASLWMRRGMAVSQIRAAPAYSITTGRCAPATCRARSGRGSTA